MHEVYQGFLVVKGGAQAQVIIPNTFAGILQKYINVPLVEEFRFPTLYKTYKLYVSTNHSNTTIELIRNTVIPNLYAILRKEELIV